MVVQGQTGTGGQHRRQAERHIGALHHFFNLADQGFRHAHATEIRVTTQTVQTGFYIGLVGFFETRSSGYFAVFPGGTDFVTIAVQRRQNLAGDLAAGFQNGFGCFSVDGALQACQRSPEFVGFKNFVQDKAHVAQWSFIVCHVSPHV